nr:GspH/FimT family pseudopilin [Chromohalobacter nigrandesensis]
MASIAVPSFQSLRQHQQLTDASNELVAALRLARGEAIMREDEVTLSAVEDDDWAQGWRIEVDEDNKTIAVHQPLPDRLSVEDNDARSPIVFDSLGYPTGNKAEWRLHLRGQEPLDDMPRVCMSAIGRAYVADPDDENDGECDA